MSERYVMEAAVNNSSAAVMLIISEEALVPERDKYKGNRDYKWVNVSERQCERAYASDIIKRLIINNISRAIEWTRVSDI